LTLVRREPRARSCGDESHVIGSSTSWPVRQLDLKALAHTLGQSGGPALPSQYCGEAQ
jgi:hypothetical protein